ncbi:MAG: quinone-dependent dihydroorotate dehydrogenase [Rhizobium sp.]|nr:MAG: quinone-dependent dihydroorotate dehydrogenase [Rhizobium sp.]
MNIYESVLRPVMFRMDPETAHHFALDQLAAIPPQVLRLIFGPAPAQPREVFGITFPNPVGLAAGMDKNATSLAGWEALGFGFVEIGTITAHAQPGNPKPRIFRYPPLGALVNRMGFNNDGSEEVARRLTRLKEAGEWPRIPVGVNIGKSKITPLEGAPEDYLTSFRRLRAFGDYFVINVSSPNTPGLRNLQETGLLRDIVRGIRSEDAKIPLLVKIAPDLADEQAFEIAAMAEEENVSGLIATNTTIDHSALAGFRDETGGLSGKPLRTRASQLLRDLKKKTKLPIIASGGVMDGDSGKEKFDAGASLVQIYTGFIYRGPQLIRAICRAAA